MTGDSNDALRPTTLRTERYFRERAARGEVETFKEILRQAGAEPPRPGDEIRDESPAKARAGR